MKLDRRKVLVGTSAAITAAISSSHANGAAIAATRQVKFDASNLSDEYKRKHSVRFSSQDVESAMDFLEGFKVWFRRDRRNNAHVERIKGFLRSIDIDPDVETSLNNQESFETLLKYPIYAAQIREEWTMMDVMWDRAFRHFHINSDYYLSSLEKTDTMGPGSLELNPKMEIPEYSAHEIHRMPGGYVGDPFAGFVFHWAIARAYSMGHYEYGENSIRLVQGHPLPADGIVKRVIELGCSSGTNTTAFKERFPDAEVWGLDVGGPMVRYAHHRAVKLGVPVHFVQRRAEASKFPDSHFDMVCDHLLFHETSAENSKRIVKEIHRILRPGGVWKHNDVPTAGNDVMPIDKTVMGKAQAWNASRHNYEPFWFQWQALDFPQVMRDAGFNIQFNWADYPRYVPSIVATKPA